MIEDAMHHTVDTATCHKIHFRFFMIPVPDRLDMAGNGGIHLQEILKLIENEGEVVGATEIQHLLKKLGKVFKLAINMQPQNLFGCFLKLLYQHMLIVFRNVQVQHILLCLYLHEQSRFANSSSAHQHRKE